jgi:hypothetical protein
MLGIFDTSFYDNKKKELLNVRREIFDLKHEICSSIFNSRFTQVDFFGLTCQEAFDNIKEFSKLFKNKQ